MTTLTLNITIIVQRQAFPLSFGGHIYTGPYHILDVLLQLLWLKIITFLLVWFWFIANLFNVKKTYDLLCIDWIIKALINMF